MAFAIRHVHAHTGDPFSEGVFGGDMLTDLRKVHMDAHVRHRPMYTCSDTGVWRALSDTLRCTHVVVSGRGGHSLDTGPMYTCSGIGPRRATGRIDIG